MKKAFEYTTTKQQQTTTNNNKQQNNNKTTNNKQQRTKIKEQKSKKNQTMNTFYKQTVDYNKLDNLSKIIKCQAICRRWLTQKTQGLSSLKLLKLPCHIEFDIPLTQMDYYKDNNSSKEILQYVNLQGKTFGEKYMERLAKEYFNLKIRTESGHDHIKCNKKIEQKSARYHANGGDWKWQHIEMKHEWDYLLLCGLDFNEIKFYIASRNIVENLIIEGIIVGQGKKLDGVAQPQQAYWFSRSDFKKKDKKFTDYFIKINSERDLKTYLHTF